MGEWDREDTLHKALPSRTEGPGGRQGLASHASLDAPASAWVGCASPTLTPATLYSG